MSQKERIVLTFTGKVRSQLDELKEKTNATSYAEVVRKSLDLLQTQAMEEEA